jgi:hypothetical protein
MSARRRPPAPAPRSGPLFWAASVVLTIAVPGVGHIYAQMLTRGFMWLAGNMLILFVLTQGDAGTGGLLVALGGLRLAAVADLVMMLRARAGKPDSGGGGSAR